MKKEITGPKVGQLPRSAAEYRDAIAKLEAEAKDLDATAEEHRKRRGFLRGERAMGAPVTGEQLDAEDSAIRAASDKAELVRDAIAGLQRRLREHDVADVRARFQSDVDAAAKAVRSMGTLAGKLDEAWCALAVARREFAEVMAEVSRLAIVLAHAGVPEGEEAWGFVIQTAAGFREYEDAALALARGEGSIGTKTYEETRAVANLPLQTRRFGELVVTATKRRRDDAERRALAGESLEAIIATKREIPRAAPQPGPEADDAEVPVPAVPVPVYAEDPQTGAQAITPIGWRV